MLAEAIIGHFVGDYILQNDWMARNKKNPSPGRNPGVESEDYLAYIHRCGQHSEGFMACSVHCLIWTISVTLCAGLFTQAGGGMLFLWLFGTHYWIDRTQFIRWWMGKVGQTGFRDGLAPWSSIAVDNTFHLLTILVGFRFLI